jgi:choline dehydrogenase-like flavoprotein
MLDAGPLGFNRVRETSASTTAIRGFGKPGRLPHVVQATEFNANQWVDEKQIPYTHAPGEPFNWVRVRIIGGKSLFWARMSFRLSDCELKAKDHDGFGENWPLSAADLRRLHKKAMLMFRQTLNADALTRMSRRTWLA